MKHSVRCGKCARLISLRGGHLCPVPQGANEFWPNARRCSNGCWEWTGSVDHKGYGSFRLNGDPGAHRAAYTLTYGPIPAGALICHRCNNRRCVNPAHLYAGTQRDNALDRSAAGTQTGSRNPFARLNETQVADIKRRLNQGETAVAIGRMYGVAPATIKKIRHQQSWRQVEAAA